MCKPRVGAACHNAGARRRVCPPVRMRRGIRLRARAAEGYTTVDVLPRPQGYTTVWDTGPHKDTPLCGTQGLTGGVQYRAMVARHCSLLGRSRKS